MNATAAAGLDAFRHENGALGAQWEPEILGAGVAFLDFDGDGWEDLLLVGGGSLPGAANLDVPALWLYRNMQDGTFLLANEEAGLSAVRAYGMGLAVADYDNDGDTDFLLTTLNENLLFKNEDARFTEAGRDAGLANTSEWSTSAIFFDVDRDGWLDLFVANYLSWSPETDRDCHSGPHFGYCTPESIDGTASRFYRNKGDGTFEERTHEAGFASAIRPARDKALGVAELDFNADGWPDLFVANDTERDLLYVNNGDGTFSERGVQLAVAYSETGKARAGMGTDVGFVDDSGYPTIFVGNFSGEAAGAYRYSETGSFYDRAHHVRLALPTLKTLTFGLFLFDLDLDGDLDLLAANGHVQEYISAVRKDISFRQPVQLFVNDGAGNFDELAPDAFPSKDVLIGRGAAYADFDRDGDLDLVLTENAGPVRLWRNESAGAGAVKVRLHGSRSNRDAYGSEVVAFIGGKKLIRRVRGGSSYLSHSEITVTFGLGEAKQIDSLLIGWPDGRFQWLGTIAAGDEIHVYEDAPHPVRRGESETPVAKRS